MTTMHKKPLSQEPSRRLISWLPLLNDIPPGIIVDLACGYGRNGAAFVEKGRKVCFVDKNADALEFIRNGVGVGCSGDLNVQLIKTLQRDLCNDVLPFNAESIAGLVVVHYFDEDVIEALLKCLKHKGFLYYESIDDRGGNYHELPNAGWFKSKLERDFKILKFHERPSVFDQTKATIKVLAVRK